MKDTAIMEPKRIYEGEFKLLTCWSDVVTISNIIILPNYHKEVWVNCDGFSHHKNKPALVTSISSNWFLNGKLHRTNGPAVEWADSVSENEWWINGEPLSPEKSKLLKIWHERNNSNGL